MNPNQTVLSILNVSYIENICLTKTYSDILELNEWNKSDCFYWLDEGNLVIANMEERCRFTYQIIAENNFACIQSATIHDSMPH